VDIWGAGKPSREFLHVDDLSDASVFLMEHCSDGRLVNDGWERGPFNRRAGRIDRIGCGQH